ncbi:hypothetical protein L2750_11620 [Shewanella submarina]|uniref:Uncharacterized protein n=1 Tax=Shewanella submarina TaxID=2016376 RepID=A0ABV7GAY6_9GAMM|nr:hypothetical protein [Shewanella submarina]MCL1037799.1 hypothetical protein [Shewanella submarina]
MNWTDLITNPQAVIGIYKQAPSLDSFIIERLIINAGSVVISGDLAALPSPLPKRWQRSGVSRCSAKITLSGIAKLQLDGVPSIQIDSDNCLIGRGAKLSIEQADSCWQAADGTSFPHRLIVCQSDFINFRIVSQVVAVSLEGYGPSAV